LPLPYGVVAPPWGVAPLCAPPCAPPQLHGPFALGRPSGLAVRHPNPNPAPNPTPTPNPNPKQVPPALLTAEGGMRCERTQRLQQRAEAAGLDGTQP